MNPYELGYLVHILSEARKQFAESEPGSWAERVAVATAYRASRGITALGAHPQPQRLQ